ncbi:hypothetical protein LDENG_00226080, partial [Lucifuga dentata]
LREDITLHHRQSHHDFCNFAVLLCHAALHLLQVLHFLLQSLLRPRNLRICHDLLLLLRHLILQLLHPVLILL